MQITFDTANPKDLVLLTSLLSKLDSSFALAQPEVAPNTGTVVSDVSTPFAEDDSVSDGEADTPAASPAPEKAKRGRKPKAELQNEIAEPAEPVAEPAVVEEQPELPLAIEAKPATLDDVRSALQALTAEKGIPAGIELLKSFGAGRISELFADQYGEFIAKCAA